jgi:hypothetical protein
MKKLTLALALLLYPAVASAQIFVNFGWTAPPPLVEVSPGVQIVEDGGSEVFFTNGRYWVERDGRWYWARDYHQHWRFADNRRVPRFLRDHRRGEYVHWRRGEHVRRAEVRREERHERREEHREAKREHAREVEHSREVEHKRHHD